MRTEELFHRGKSFEKDMRSLIIDDILSGGGMFQQSTTQEVLEQRYRQSTE